MILVLRIRLVMVANDGDVTNESFDDSVFPLNLAIPKRSEPTYR